MPVWIPKMYVDKVRIKNTNKIGYIDAKTYEKYRVCLNVGYEWVYHREVEKYTEGMENEDNTVMRIKAKDYKWLG